MSLTIHELAMKLNPLPAGKYLVGFSGGADSVALLHLMLEKREAWGLEIEAVHVNHGLRGTASDADEQWCAEKCEKLEIPLRISRIQLNGHRDENSARIARMGCFQSWIQATGARGVALAHQRDDAAETFLMRLLRGSGPDGLAVLPPESTINGITIYRPMLKLGRAELREALQEAGISWREDASNLDETYLRNAVRHRLIPEMERLTPGTAKHIAHVADMMCKDREWMHGEAEAFLDHFPESGWIRAKDAMSLPYSLRTRVLRLWWLRDGPKLEERELNAEQTEKLMELLEQNSGRINLPGNYHAVKTPYHLHLVPPNRSRLEETVWKKPETKVGEAFLLRITASEGNPGDGIFTQEMPEDFPEGCVIRSRAPGDWIQPFGGSGRKKLQDYLVDRKVDEPWRDRVPLLCRGQEVLWAGGVGTGNIPKWTKHQNHIRLTWHGSMPWAEQGEEGKYGKNR